MGCSLSLVSSGEDKLHAKIVQALNVTFAEVAMDGRLLSGAQERVNLACKVASAEDSERKTQRDNQWFQTQAAEAGLEVDDDLLEEGLAGGDLRDKARLNEARWARNGSAANNSTFIPGATSNFLISRCPSSEASATPRCCSTAPPTAACGGARNSPPQAGTRVEANCDKG